MSLPERKPHFAPGIWVRIALWLLLIAVLATAGVLWWPPLFFVGFILIFVMAFNCVQAGE